MTLRMMLVGLVASLGCELPSDADLSCWSHSGREWVAARLADLSGPRFEVDPPVADPIEMPLAEVAQADDDRAFEAASGTMAADFAADLLASRPEVPEADDAPAPTALAELAPVGLPDGEECAIASALADDEVVASASVEDADDAPSEGEVDEATRADRIANAVRLTREAVQAWADLAQDSPDEGEPAR